MKAHRRRYDKLCVKFLSGLLWASIDGQAMAYKYQLMNLIAHVGVFVCLI